MTETEQLKKETERQYAKQRTDELITYIETLNRAVDVRRTKLLKATGVFVLAWVVWIGSGVLVGGATAFGIGFALYFMALFYTHYHDKQYEKAKSELYGAWRVLEILGMAETRNHWRRKKRRSWKEGADIVRSWFKKKKQAQQGAYAAA